MEDYGQLEKVVDDTINQIIQTKIFDSRIFIQNMETKFKVLGFREPPARGGGTENFNSAT